MAALPVEQVEGEEEVVQHVEGIGVPPEPGYLRVFWADGNNVINFIDCACYPDLTYRDLRVYIAEVKSFPLLGFALSDPSDGVLYPLDDHPEEGQKIMIFFGAATPQNSFGPYITLRDITALRTADCLLPSTLLGSAHVLSTSWLELICFRRNTSLRLGPSPPLMRVVRSMWVNEGPGSFFRGAAPILVHYLFTSVVTQLPKSFIYERPTPFWLAVVFRTTPCVSFMLALPLHRAAATQMPKASFFSQFFYLPPNAFSHIALPPVAPYVIARDTISSIWDELAEEDRPLGIWLEKRGYNASGATVRLLHTGLRLLLTHPFVITERYALFNGCSYGEALRDLYQRGVLFTMSNYIDGMLSELWLFGLRWLISEFPLGVMSWRIHRLARKYDDSAVVRRVAVESTAFFAVVVASFSAGTWYWVSRRQGM